MTDGIAVRELPKYKCHKEVWSLKIKELRHTSVMSNVAEMTPEDDRYAPIALTAEYVDKHSPEVGGYYVVYEDGYKSYSPAKAFEDGYTLVA